MPKCTKCQTDNRIGAVWCKTCGHVNPIDNGYPCPNCRKVNGPFSKRCQRCGYSYVTKTAPGWFFKNRYRRKRGIRAVQYTLLAGLFFVMILAGWSAQKETAAGEMLDRYAADVRVYKEQIVSLYSSASETGESRAVKLQQLQMDLNSAYQVLSEDNDARGVGAGRSKLMDVYGELVEASIYAQTREETKLNEALVMAGREMQNYERIHK